MASWLFLTGDAIRALASAWPAPGAARKGIKSSLTRPPPAAHTRRTEERTMLSAPSRRRAASGPGAGFPQIMGRREGGNGGTLMA